MSFKISLIATTRGRCSELRQLFESLLVQSYRNFELILVNQGDDPAVAALGQEFKGRGLELVHLPAPLLSLSAARNLGLRKVTGDILGFPDDDCFYAPDFLRALEDRFRRENLSLFSCVACDHQTGQKLLSSFPASETAITYSNLFGVGMSVTFFFSRESVQELSFDEALGAGCYIGSGEETDFSIRAFHRRPRGRFYPDLEVYHPYFPPRPELTEKFYHYGLGYGVVLRRHFRPAFWRVFLTGMIIRPFGGALINVFNRPRLLWCLAILRGRWRGFLLGERLLRR